MFLEVNNQLLNTKYLDNIELDDNKLIYWLVNGTKRVEECSSAADAQTKYNDLVTELTTSGGGGGGSTGENANYSTSEVKMGKWHNGKDLYRRVFTNVDIGSDNPGADRYVLSMDPSVTEICFYDGFIMIDDTIQQKFPLNFWVSSTYYNRTKTELDNNVQKFVIKPGKDTLGKKATIIAYYTK